MPLQSPAPVHALPSILKTHLQTQAALRYDPRCAMCRWGLAYAAGPYPNVVTGSDDAQYPVFGPTAARRAEVRAARQAVGVMGVGGGLVVQLSGAQQATHDSSTLVIQSGSKALPPHTALNTRRSTLSLRRGWPSRR